MRRTIPFLFLPTLLAVIAVAQSNLPKTYKGTPYLHAPQIAPQTIPGKVECAFYDEGGEGVAYHDTDAVNQGSGKLNPANGTYLNEFRLREGVDISYTKFHNSPERIDDNPWTIVMPPANQLYVGWTEPGEWFNITVEVHHAGAYTADLLYTSNRGGTISIDLNGRPATGPLTIPTTNNPADPVAWRQWHHWNIASNLLKLKLPTGRSVLTIHILTEGQMNLATFDFRPLS
ncbi:hypothetical protein [Edaphobacter modestus]|uniref:Carbohydrate binding protein with CBM6 domain n=1 Tax=Edaphobacter modestus TaxID=388466 RepID=A0A4Q7YUM6_9BACT|nr:hypothetical protein [Edaphobacter modestus]RZU41477.1 carbohydrate binding protein with CBM6 domain [Edaphobacter modestus]